MQDMSSDPPPRLSNADLTPGTSAMNDAAHTQSMADEWVTWSPIAMHRMLDNALDVNPTFWLPSWSLL